VKKVLFPILAVVLAAALTIPMMLVSAHTEEGPYVTNLLAGQTEDVGDIKVWNDGDSLYVTYEITEPDWVITETHLYAGKNVPPTTAPGQFPYDDGDATLVTDTVVTYEIPLDDIDSYSMQLNRKGKSTGVTVADGTPGVEPCNDVYIAAHAVVEKCVTESLTLYPDLTWQRSGESGVAVYPGYGAQWTKEEGFAIGLDPEAIVWDGGTVSQYFTGYSTRSDISWASWVCTENPSGKSTTGTDLRRFQATFDIPVGYSVTGGTLGSVNPGYESVIPMNDNIYIFVNEELIFWGGTISLAGLDPGRTHFLGMERRDTEPQDKSSFPETDGWHMDGAIPAISSSLFVEGANVLDVFAEELWTGGGMHELGLTLEGEQTTCETETAWGAGTDFEQPNWAMYFVYTVQGCLLVDTVEVPSNGTSVSSITLDTGKTYLFKASGTFTYNNAGDWADAEWYLKGGVIVKGDTEGSKPYVLDISIDGYSINREWGDYNPEHIYYMDWPGTGVPVFFSIYDSAYGDNAGNLTVEIYECCE